MDNVSLMTSHSRHTSKVPLSSNRNNPAANLPALHIPPMSDAAMKRWCDARDAYLGHQYPYVQSQQETKFKPKLRHNYETISIFTIESDRLSKTNLRQSLQQQQKTRIVHDHFDDKCIGTESNEKNTFKTDIEQVDEAIQVDLPSPQFELHHEYDTTMVDGEQQQQQHTKANVEPIEYCDKAVETDPISNNETENVTTQTNTEKSEPPYVSHRYFDDDDDDTKTILSSTDSNVSFSEQFRRLQHRFKRLSKERRLLSCLLLIYVLIMLGLLVVIIFLIWTFPGKSLVLGQEVTQINSAVIEGVAQYGEACTNNNDCKRPFTCFKNRASSSGICRCAINYTLVNNQCIGDLDAICTKDKDCQRYMLCSGMEDRTRRCHCQNLYHYDFDRKQCRGEYDAPCQTTTDCLSNLICNKTATASTCSCELNYRYYSLEHKCRGDSGAVCEQATAECIENAECRDGACQCAFQFIPDESQRCVDPCPRIEPNPVRIRYPGNCRRFIDCQQRTKGECPQMTIFNFRTQLCDYPKNVIDCR
ncbi:unnamed protein product [Adineta ricciae]|uniref:Chitin-binding type-2 domain-containing protein n=1 Tax=Adineta ricciae TaxID=249248 RepID=A0A815AGM9_ADIRI|nr:unnamed protein product [Adineta ricciae]CAF1256804.1 unnamed protein product [Adineta ricciae]